MRQQVMISDDGGLLIRQGKSEWLDAQTVRDKIQRLQKHGAYNRYQNLAQGLYRLEKARKLLKTRNTPGIRVRTGDRGKWIPVERWLRTPVLTQLRNDLTRAIDNQREPEFQTKKTRRKNRMSILQQTSSSRRHPMLPQSP